MVMKSLGKITKRYLLLLLGICMLLCCGMFAGTGAVRAEAANTKVQLEEKDVSIEVGKTYKLKVLNTSETVTWETSDKKIAKVSSKGKVTAKKAGSCKIYATVGTKKLTCRVTVYNNYSVNYDKYSISGFSTLMGKLPLKKFKYEDAPAYFKELSLIGKNCVAYFGLTANKSDIALDSDNYVYIIKNIIKYSEKYPDNLFLGSLAETAKLAYESNALFEDDNGNDCYIIIQRESDFDTLGAASNDGDKENEGFFFIYYPNKKATDFDCIMIGCDEGSFENITVNKN
ncbi:MAG: Ig-like domain-containing protein [Lachnospiraceae bacterium]|nr:Ig-like domain-containing protein [Lachnospiraceae bacterium]